MLKMLVGWAINAGALLVLPYLLSEIKVDSFTTALVVALVIGLLNVLLKPILFVLTLPVNILTLGLFTFVLNGLMFWLASKMVSGFTVANFWWAIIGSLVFSLISWAVSSLLIDKRP